jgi:hypothetical protein
MQGPMTTAVQPLRGIEGEARRASKVWIEPNPDVSTEHLRGIEGVARRASNVWIEPILTDAASRTNVWHHPPTSVR